MEADQEKEREPEVTEEEKKAADDIMAIKLYKEAIELKENAANEVDKDITLEEFKGFIDPFL
jgi:hypothetical protein